MRTNVRKLCCGRTNIGYSCDLGSTTHSQTPATRRAYCREIKEERSYSVFKRRARGKTVACRGRKIKSTQLWRHGLLEGMSAEKDILTGIDVEPHRNARVLVKGEGDDQVDPRHALRLVEVTPSNGFDRHRFYSHTAIIVSKRRSFASANISKRPRNARQDLR